MQKSKKWNMLQYQEAINPINPHPRGHPSKKLSFVFKASLRAEFSSPTAAIMSLELSERSKI